jgi:hypothetical protein
MEGYLVYGMCRYLEDLDYIVGLHVASNELRVIRLDVADR